MAGSYFRYEGANVVAYVCCHGFDSGKCEVSVLCPTVGERMLEWQATLPNQMNTRLARRSMMIDTEQNPDLTAINRQ